MAYNKPDLTVLGKAIVKMAYAVGDGLDVTDVAVGMELLQAFMSAANELREDTDAALLHTLAAAMDDVGDKRINPPTP